MPACWDDYQRFKPLCCVDSMPFSRGKCWTIGLQAEDESYWIDPDVGFIGYNWPYRYNSIRTRAIPGLEELPERSKYTYINRNIVALARVMVRPDWRGRGYASWLIKNTVELVGAKYIECLTFTETIASILIKSGFVNHGKTGGLECDYFLWTNTRQADKSSAVKHDHVLPAI